MGKRRLRKTYRSKGERPNVSAKILNAVSNEKSFLTKQLNVVDAWLKGKNPWVQVPEGKTFVKKRANDVYGFWKTARANVFKEV